MTSFSAKVASPKAAELCMQLSERLTLQEILLGMITKGRLEDEAESSAPPQKI